MNKAASFETLTATVMQSSARAIINASDYVFRLWPDGEIAQVTFASGVAGASTANALVGRLIAEIAEPEDKVAIERMVEAALNGRGASKATIRHSDLIGQGTAAQYSAHLTADGKNIVMIGSSISSEVLRATELVDAEIARYRRIDRDRLEAEYRQLFQLSTDGLMIVNTANGQIDEANGHAADILGQPLDSLVGQPFASVFDTEESVGQIAFDGLSETETADELRITVTAPGTEFPITVTTQMARGTEWPFMIVRMTRHDAEGHPADGIQPLNAPDHADRMTIELLRNADIPIALTDGSGAAVWANAAMERLTGQSGCVGSPIADVLGVSEAALARVMQTSDAHGRLLTSLSALESRLARDGDAYVAIVSISTDPDPGYGLIIHKIMPTPERALEPDTSADQEKKDALADLVGQAPMKVLVRRSTDVIERKCIEAALHLTENNRAAAANVLGLSRQSLYIKLRQHGLL
ncbi:MAG: PAS domain-containing protein [Pseudomonadota bacterium]